MRKLFHWIGHIWYYYRIFIIFFSILSVTLSFTIYQFFSQIPPDLRIAYYQVELKYKQKHLLQDYLEPHIKDINNDDLKTLVMTPLVKVEKLKLFIISQATPIIIIDKATLLEMTEAFEPLDRFISQSTPIIKAHPEVVILTEEKKQKYIYALPLDKHTLITNNDLPLKEYYLVMLRQDLKKDKESQDFFGNAELIIKLFIKDSVHN